MDTRDLAGGSASDLKTAPSDPNIRLATTKEATTFLSLPRELRDQIYSYSLKTKTVYTQISLDACLINLRLDRIEGSKTLPARQLDVLRVSRKLWEECSKVLYQENLFHLHVGSTLYNTTLLTRKTTDLMQRVEIDLHLSKELESVRAMQLFGGSRVLRKSCVIKLQFHKVDHLHYNMVEALKNMTGFEILVFEIDAPHGIPRRYPASQGISPASRWIWVLWDFITTNLTPTMGPSTCETKNPHRRLKFRPQDYRRQETGGK